MAFAFKLAATTKSTLNLKNHTNLKERANYGNTKYLVMRERGAKRGVKI